MGGGLLGLHALGLDPRASPTFLCSQSRLQEEHDALEEANVQAVLAQAPLVDAVVVQMRKVQGMLGERQ